MAKPISFTRQEMYDLVWRKPKRDIAAEIGVSDVAVAKACRKANIPVPGRGYWARKAAGKPIVKADLPPRFPGASDTVEFGPDRWDSGWQSKLLNNPLPPPPEFSEPIEDVRQRVQKLVGTVKYPALTGRRHPLIAKLLEQDEIRRVAFAKDQYPWDRPLFDSPAERRRLRILNAIFLAVSALGCRPYMTASKWADDKRETNVTVGDRLVAIELETVQTKRRGTEKSQSKKPRLTFSILTGGRGSDARRVWEDTEERQVEKALTEIAVEIVVTGEVEHREGVQARYEWKVRRKAELEEEARQAKIEAERKARELREQQERERVEKLLAAAKATQQADTIRRFVATARSRVREATISAEAFDEWAKWALAQADRIDPITTLSFLNEVDRK